MHVLALNSQSTCTDMYKAKDKTEENKSRKYKMIFCFEEHESLSQNCISTLPWQKVQVDFSVYMLGLKCEFLIMSTCVGLDKLCFYFNLLCFSVMLITCAYYAFKVNLLCSIMLQKLINNDGKYSQIYNCLYQSNQKQKESYILALAPLSLISEGLGSVILSLRDAIMYRCTHTWVMLDSN